MLLFESLQCSDMVECTKTIEEVLVHSKVENMRIGLKECSNMKRRLGGAVVRRAITVAMTMMLVCSSAGTVLADDAVPVVEMSTEDLQEQDSNTDVLLAGEILGEQSARSVEEAQEAEESAEVTVDEAESAVETITDEYSETIRTAVEEIKQAEETVKNIVDDAKELAGERQEEVDKAAQSVQDSMEDGQIIHKEETDEDVTEKGLQEYIGEQAQKAEAARDEAKDNLDKALTIKPDSEEARQQLKECAEAAQKAADDANEAKKAAESAYDEAKDALTEDIKLYNAYAKAYGYELKTDKDGKTPEYTQEELEAKGLLPEAKDDEVKSRIQQIKDTQASVIEAAQNTVEQAEAACNTARENAEDALETAQQAAELATEYAQAAEALEALQAEHEKAMEAVASANQTVAEAKDNYDKVQEELDALIKQVSENKPNLKELLEAIQEKEKALNKACANLYKAQNAQKKAAEYARLTNGLAEGAKARFYGRKDENGEVATSNPDIDKTDSEVKSQPITDFVEMTADRTSISIPYEVFSRFASHMSGIGQVYTDGKGISAINGTMPVIYWTLNENGQIDENSTYYIASDGNTIPDGMESGKTYFKAYAFKHEPDGYHVDGIEFLYNKTPDQEPAKPTVNDDAPGENKDGGNDQNNTVAISDTVTPLASAVPDTVMIPDESVPLAEDIVTIEEDKTPLSDSVPQTGDNSIPAAPFAAAGTAALGAALIMKLRRRKHS